MVEKILNNTTPYGKIRASHEGWLHSSTLKSQSSEVSYFKIINIHILKMICNLINLKTEVCMY